jgi:hypothetical protein
MTETTVAGITDGQNLTDEEKAAALAELQAKADAYDVLMAQKAPVVSRVRVRVSNPVSLKRVVFSSVSETRARAWLESHCPRGSEFYLELPDGSTHAYEVERTGAQGADVELWQPYDYESYVAPSMNEPPGQDAWADVES